MSDDRGYLFNPIWNLLGVVVSEIPGQRANSDNSPSLLAFLMVARRVFFENMSQLFEKTAATLKPADNLNLGNNVTDTKTMLMD